MNKKTKTIFIIAFMAFIVIIFIMNITIKQRIPHQLPALKIDKSDSAIDIQATEKGGLGLQAEERQEAPLSPAEPLLE